MYALQSVIMQRVVMVNLIMVTVVAFYADCRFAKCRYYHYQHAERGKTEGCYAEVNDTHGHKGESS
jgi:hypothetical protein